MSRRLVGDPKPSQRAARVVSRKAHRGGAIPSFGGPWPPKVRPPSRPATVEGQLALLRTGQMVELRSQDAREVFGRIVSIDDRAVCIQPLGWRGQRLTIMVDAIEVISAANLSPQEHRVISGRQAPPDAVGSQPWPQRYGEDVT